MHEPLAPTPVDPSSDRKKTMFSALWTFAMFNYLYADLIGLMDASTLRQYLTGHVNGLDLTPTFLLSAAVLMELPIAMTLLSRVLEHRANRRANLAAGALKTVVVLATLFVGTPPPYYVFFAVIEMLCTSLIVWMAWRWTLEPLAASAPSPALAAST